MSTSTVTVPNAAELASVMPGPRRRVARSVLGLWRSSYIWGYALVLAVVAAAIAVAIDTFGTLEAGTWGWTVNHIRFVVGVTGMMMVQALKLCVANGITRRDGLLGIVEGAAGLVVLVGGIVAAGHGVEWLVFAGSDTVVTTVTSVGVLALTWLASAVLLLTYFLSGWLITVGYLRFGWIAATVAVVPALVPVVIVELVWGAALGLDALFFAGLADRWDLSVWVAAPVAVAISAAVLGGSIAVLRRGTGDLPFAG